MDIHGENEFNIKSIWYFLQTINIHIYSKYEYIGFIDNAIKKIKEREISVCYTAPYRWYTQLMTQYLVEGVIKMLNTPNKKCNIRHHGTRYACRRGKKNDFGKKRI